MKQRISLNLFLLLFCALSFFGCRPHYLIQEPKTVTGVIAIDSTLPLTGDSISLLIIEPYKAAMEAEMNEVLAYSETPIVKDQPEGALGSLVADIVLTMTSEYYLAQGGQAIDFCLLNNGGLRSSLPKGEIKTRNIFELMPFENKLVVMQISGQNAKKLFDFIARSGGMPVAGVRMGIKEDKAVNITVGQQAFDSTRTYLVATSDYLAEGGDDMRFFNNPLQKIELKQKIREAIIEFLRRTTAEGKTIDARTDNRVYYEK